MQCGLEVTYILVDLTPELVSKNSNYSAQEYATNLQGVKFLVLDGWEVHSYAIFPLFFAKGHTMTLPIYSPSKHTWQGEALYTLVAATFGNFDP